MKDVSSFLSACFGENAYPDELETFLAYVSKLEFDATPDYNQCREIFQEGLRKRKLPLDGKIDFSTPKSPAKKVCRNAFESLVRLPLHEKRSPVVKKRRLCKRPVVSGGETIKVRNPKVERDSQTSPTFEKSVFESFKIRKSGRLEEKRQKSTVRSVAVGP